METKKAWEQWLEEQGIINQHQQWILTEGALMGGLLAQGIPINLGIVSDDAGQSGIFGITSRNERLVEAPKVKRGGNAGIPLPV